MAKPMEPVAAVNAEPESGAETASPITQTGTEDQNGTARMGRRRWIPGGNGWAFFLRSLGASWEVHSFYFDFEDYGCTALWGLYNSAVLSPAEFRPLTLVVCYTGNGDAACIG